MAAGFFTPTTTTAASSLLPVSSSESSGGGGGLRRRLSSISLVKMEDIIRPAAGCKTWMMGEYGAGGGRGMSSISISMVMMMRNWWEWGLAWILSMNKNNNATLFTTDLEMSNNDNEETTNDTTLGHVFFSKLRSHINKLIISSDLPQTYKASTTTIDQ